MVSVRYFFTRFEQTAATMWMRNYVILFLITAILAVITMFSI